MKIEIVAKNYHVADKLQQVLLTKIGKLSKYFADDATPCKVVLSETGRQSKMEISINHNGVQIRAEVVGNTMYYNIDECLPKLERQIVKHRDRLNDRKRMPKITDDYQFVSDVEMSPAKIVKTKSFEIEAMTAIEAAENLELVGHDFYLFENQKTGNVEAVYRRKDGSVGLLQPVKTDK